MSRDCWVTIKGFERYQINPYGDVVNKTTLKKLSAKDANGQILVHLWNGEKQVCKTVAHLVAETFLKRKPEKTHVWHKNGIYTDNYVGNLEWVTRHELSCRMAAANPRRRPVVKQAPSGETVEVYASMADAGRRNYLSERAIRNRCFRKVANPYELDGYNYIFEK